MKFKINHTRLLLITFTLSMVLQNGVFCQSEEEESKKRSGFFLGMNFGPSQTLIEINGLQAIGKVTSTEKKSYSGSFEIGGLFSRFFGMSTGIGINSFKTELALDPYQSSYDTKDSDNEPYNRRINGNNISEIQNIDFLEIPATLIFQLPFGKWAGIFLQSGVNFSFPLRNDYSSSGTFSFSGYYPSYNALLQDMPEFGFPSVTKSAAEGDLNLKSFSASLALRAGFYFFAGQKIQVGIGASYDNYISDISENTTPEKFQLTSDINKINSMMGGSSKTTANSMGLRLSIRYFFK